ncbi:Catechol 2,3-dioxygenase [Pseudovibrio denitrificans]|uniref:Bleomycin resistance protein n=1 Tax=Pseudovibrio denitrificans TaxID=258256 RepID=A0A1I7CIU1_9HYPH|nr:VOC family protein [Pseudovibrio denitrificans]SFT99358.1 Catechol 2,3-dioxygenase [Pseudovibrio denitrificans]
MSNPLVPEFAVSDWLASKRFYCDMLGFDCLYERPEEGFCYLSLGGAEIMLDQIGIGRTFDNGHAPQSYPFGKGLNVQIEVDTIEPMVRKLKQADIALFLEPEDKWYRKNDGKVGNRQFVVADPDGYLLRFCQSLGSRKI